MVRVCVVSALYHPSLGGLGRQAQRLTEKLAEEGVSIFVIARRMKGMPYAEFSPKVKVYRAWSLKPYLHTFEDITFTNILVSLSFCISCAILLIRKRKEYDIVHFYGASLPLVFNVPVLKILCKRTIALVAGVGFGSEAGSLREKHFGLGNLLIKILRAADIFVAMTTEIENGLLSDGFSSGRIVRIPNFLDFNAFSPVSPEMKARIRAKAGMGSAIVVVFTGRLIKCKGVEVLLKAWTDVAERYSDARLLIVGDGNMKTELYEMAGQYGILKSVVFVGFSPKVKDFLNMADIFVFPSLHEGMPSSLLEAMACRLPVVATNIGGVTDFLKDGENGVIVEPGDSDGLARGIGKLIENRELSERIANNAYETIKTGYSLDYISQRYSDLYNTMALCKP